MSTREFGTPDGTAGTDVAGSSRHSVDSTTRGGEHHTRCQGARPSQALAATLSALATGRGRRLHLAADRRLLGRGAAAGTERAAGDEPADSAGAAAPDLGGRKLP